MNTDKVSDQKTPAPAAEQGWTRWLPWVVLILAALYIVGAAQPPKAKGDFDYVAFGRLPVLLNGRIKPLDTVARTSLLQIAGQQKVPLEGNGPDRTWGEWDELQKADGGRGLYFRKWYQFGKRPKSLSSTPWLMEVLMRPDVADTRFVFRVHHPELLREMGLEEKGVDQSGLRFYSFNQMRPHLLSLHREKERIGKIPDAQRNPYEQSKYKLAHVLELYVQLRHSLQPNRLDLGPRAGSVPSGVADYAADLKQLARDGKQQAAAFDQFIKESGQHAGFFSTMFQHVGDRLLEQGALPAEDEALAALLVKDLTAVRDGNRERLPEMSPAEREQYQQVEAAIAAFLTLDPSRQAGLARHLLSVQSRYQTMDSRANLLLIPPMPDDDHTGHDHSDGHTHSWTKTGATVLTAVRTGKMPEPVTAYGAMSTAFVQGKPGDFNTAVLLYVGWLHGNGFQAALDKGRKEHYFNHTAPFARSMYLYLLALLLAAFSWLNLSRWLMRSAFYLIGLAFLIHTAGLIARMLLEGRPPVTNLYSSAVFVGWGSVLLGWILERVFRNGIGSCTAGAIGFATLIIADHLALEGDTMEMMRAVLDTNFWLATHVTCITIGYASTFLAGFLALVYVLRGTLTRTLSAETAQSLARMVYGIVCFAMLFSFVGTVLGGIWADQSWGRFWGWDAKENGALLIVIWNALILHCRWGGIVRDRGLMNLAIFGNVVTAWSWFGVNMLGIGLHSYGFMDEAFNTLKWFGFSHILLIVVGSLPLHYWASGKELLSGPPRPPA